MNIVSARIAAYAQTSKTIVNEGKYREYMEKYMDSRT